LQIVKSPYLNFNEQESQLWQRDRAMLGVAEYFAKLLKITEKVIRNDTLEKGISPY